MCQEAGGNVDKNNGVVFCGRGHDGMFLCERKCNLMNIYILLRPLFDKNATNMMLCLSKKTTTVKTFFRTLWLLLLFSILVYYSGKYMMNSRHRILEVCSIRQIVPAGVCKTCRQVVSSRFHKENVRECAGLSCQLVVNWRISGMKPCCV